MPGRWIDFELKDVRGHVNRPVVKGWAFALGIIGLVAMYAELIWLSNMTPRPTLLPAILVIFTPPVLWFVALFAVGHFEVELELRPQTLAVRTWTELFLDRPGIDLGPPAHVTAMWLDLGHFRLNSPTAEVVVSMTLWPSWMRAEVGDHLDHWGIELQDPTHPDSHGSRKTRRKRDARAARQ